MREDSLGPGDFGPRILAKAKTNNSGERGKYRPGEKRRNYVDHQVFGKLMNIRAKKGPALAGRFLRSLTFGQGFWRKPKPIIGCF